MNAYLREVEQRLLSLKASPSKWKAADYVGGGESSLRYLDLKIPRVRAEYKKGFSFSLKPAVEQWKIWDFIWNHSEIFEVMLMASWWVSGRPFEEVVAHRKAVLKWLGRVDNWAHSDEMSGHTARFFEHDPTFMKDVIETWSVSKNPWLKRQSLVGILFYARFRKSAPPAKFILGLIERHIDDDHYYVQKGIGWTLRECWMFYPRDTLAYMMKNAARIPAAGWTAATERLSAKEKARLKAARKNQKR